MPDLVTLPDLTYAQLQELLVSWGEPSFRAEQLWRWLYCSLAEDFQAMRNLPKKLRHRLSQATRLWTLRPLAESVSADGLTRKILFALKDSHTIESVEMHYQSRNTVCLSSQVGCALGCPFCATGQSGLVRNLTAGEIVEQVVFFARGVKARGEKIDNVVIMGMGEPLANYAAVWQAIETLNDHRGFNLGARRITVSTVGLVPGIDRLSGESLQVGLAISLHAPNDALRDKLLPINRRYPLRELLAACGRYVARTGRRITFEYALIEGLNDSVEQARSLAHLLKGLLCHVNLISLNPVDGSPYRPSSRKRVAAFGAELKRQGIACTVRLSRGIDIQAGCGQLRARHFTPG